MMASTQTVWAQLIASTLADAGVTVCVVSPGSRSTPLVAALAREPRLARVTIIDERAAAFYALGVARATGLPAALVCTSGTAAAHYLPAIAEASLAGVPLIALTADRPPELQQCGASQTMPQVGLYGSLVRGAFDLGAPVGSEASLRGLRRTVVQAITLARGPAPGPVHLEVPLRKPLEPVAPTTDAERDLAAYAARLAGPVAIAPPHLAADPDAIARVAALLAAEPDGLIVAGAMPVAFAAHGAAVRELARRTGYPIVAEAGSQLRFAGRTDHVVFLDHFDVMAVTAMPVPRVIVQLGADPVAASWPAVLARAVAAGCRRVVLAGTTWSDPDSSAEVVLLGDVGAAAAAIAAAVPAHPDPLATSRAWQALEVGAAMPVLRALEAHPTSEAALLRAALVGAPEGTTLQIGNSLPIRVMNQIAAWDERAVITQRGVAGIDGLIASAAGATRAGRPVLLVLGDVSFVHDLGALVAARTPGALLAPLCVLVIDNGGGQIFAGLPVARADLGAAFEEHWLTPPGVDPVAVARALGIAAVRVESPGDVARAVATALAPVAGDSTREHRVTVVHGPVSPSGARDVRRMAIELQAPGVTV